MFPFPAFFPLLFVLSKMHEEEKEKKEEKKHHRGCFEDSLYISFAAYLSFVFLANHTLYLSNDLRNQNFSFFFLDYFFKGGVCPTSQCPNYTAHTHTHTHNHLSFSFLFFTFHKQKKKKKK
eukprot:TRINITY_DN1179_c0_g2_i1.p1 TRINITY_DN1179_c0_g2~~TRINITY_DN1179_c0_g2_i1.p1  ORF type:complete len:121 (-),score=8.09 TRINITY_DN1179_c0_g2_i1:20-382(-)